MGDDISKPISSTENAPSSDREKGEKPPIPISKEESLLGDNTPDLLDNEEDDELLIEEDGDFFWLLQRIVWGVLKFVFGFGLLGVAIWFIWTSNIHPLGDKAPRDRPVAEDKAPITKEPQSPKKDVVIDGETPVTPTDLRVSDFVDWADYIEQNTSPRVPLQGIGPAIDWIGQVHRLFEVPVNQDWLGNSPEIRSQNIEQLLSDIRIFVQDSVFLRKALAGQINQWYAQIQRSEDTIFQIDQELDSAFGSFAAVNIETQLQQKIRAQKDQIEGRTYFESTRFVLQIMEGYDRSLREFYENIQANKNAIVQNIRVVQFPQDPFDVILTPAEWRSTTSDR